MIKLELFMQELMDNGSDFDLVQFNATLCQRSDNLLSALFSNNDIDALRLFFSAYNRVSNLIGELTSHSSSAARRTIFI